MLKGRWRWGIPATLFLGGLISGMLFEHYQGRRALIELAGVEGLLLQYGPRRIVDRVPVPWPTTSKGRIMVALVFGQSNAGNSGETTSAGRPGVYEFYRGRIYDARDPLLNTDGTGGTIWVRLATKLIDSGDFDTVVLVPVAVGSSKLDRWAPGGSLHRWLLSVVGDAHAAGLEFTHLLWQQGEADAMAGTTTASYVEQFTRMLGAIRSANVKAPVFVAQSTQCGRSLANETIRSAQARIASTTDGVYPGPDTDQLGRALRYDGCHFSSDGLEKAAELWHQAIARVTPKAKPVP